MDAEVKSELTPRHCSKASPAVLHSPGLFEAVMWQEKDTNPNSEFSPSLTEGAQQFPKPGPSRWELAQLCWV